MMPTKKRFDYTPPTYEEMADRAERKNVGFDSILKDVKFYKPKQGVNILRILPGSWTGARHYGLQIYVHRDIGADNRAYLCNRQNPTSPYKRCLMCEALANAGPRVSPDERKALQANSAMLFYVIDRDNEKEGLQVWQTSNANDTEIAAQSVDHRNKSVIVITDEEEGYDVEFIRTGTTRNNTRYRGFKVMRDPSPLCDDVKQQEEWLDQITEKPLTEALNFYKPEYLEEVFYGRTKEDADEEKPRRHRDEDSAEDRPRRSSRDEPADETPRQRQSSRDEEPEERPRTRTRERERDPDANQGKEQESPRERSRREPEPEREPDQDRPSRSRREPEPDQEETHAERPSRTRLARDLDDEIPSESRRRAEPNGRDTEAEEERPSRTRERARTNDEDADKRPLRSREAEDDPAPSPRASRDEPVDDDRPSRVERMRARLSSN